MVDNTDPVNLEAADFQKVGLIDDAVLTIGTFLLVKFDSISKNEASSYKYVCRVLEESTSESGLTIQGLRSYNSKKEFIDCKNDICSIEKDDIIEILPLPQSSTSQRKIVTYLFSKPIGVEEK